MNKSKIILLTAMIIAVLATAFAAGVDALAAAPRVDLILENGTVLIYRGKEAGFKEGQKLSVVRDGVEVGALEVIKVANAYVQAKIASGAGAIRELDSVAAASEAAEAGTKRGKKGPSEEKAEAKAGEAAGSGGEAKVEEKTSEKKSGSRRGRGGGEETAGGEAAAGSGEATAAEDGSKKSSRRGRGAAAAATEPAAGAGGETSQGEAGAETAATQKPQTSKGEPFYSLHAGYFFLNGDVPGTVISREPSPMFSIDYWKPKKKGVSYVYSLTYARPKVTTRYASQDQRYQLKYTEFSASYIWNNLDSKVGANSNVYGGFGVGYRSATSEVYCSVSCTGVQPSFKKAAEGFDYHGIVGFRFRKRMEFKLNYCFDEKYYTIGLGYKY